MHRIAIVSCLALLACASPTEKAGKSPASAASTAAPSTPASAASAGSAAPTSAATAASLPPPVKGILTRETGKRAAEVRPPITVKAERTHVADGAVFLEVAMPADMGALLNRINSDAQLQVEGDRPGLAVPAGEGRIADRPLAFVRLTGTAVPSALTVTWSTMADLNGAAGVRQTLKIDPTGAQDSPGLAGRFYKAAGRWFRRRGTVGAARAAPFYVFAGARLEALGEAKRPGGRPEQLRRNRRGDVGEAMSLYTGWTSIEEALQADRGLRARGGDWKDAKVPLADIKAVSLPGHPWDELIAKTNAPVIEPLAAWAPAEFVYLHFSDLREMVRLMEEADTLLTPVARLLEAQAGTAHFAKRYETQLALRRSVLSKTFGHTAAKSVAIVASDPFLREGTDVSLVFHVANQALLEGTLARYATEARAARPDATETTYAIGEHTVRLLATPDGAVQRHQVMVRDVLIVSNSRAAVERIIAAGTGKTLALGASGDFRYFRARYPFAPSEMGFLFISDAFVLNAVGPRTKILQARRTMARASLAAVNYAMLLHGWLQGTPARDVKAAIGLGLLTPEDLQTPDGAPIRWSPERGARSEIWGSPAGLQPLIELDLKTVTRAEADAYRAFETTYQRYWRGFIDPIGVRFTRRPDGGLDLDGRMMPLIERSEYRDLARAVGDVRVGAPDLKAGLRLMMSVAPDSSLRRDIDRLGKDLSRKSDVGLGWLGDWVAIGIGDNPAVWDAALALGEVPSTGGRDAYRSRDNRTAILRGFPLYVAAHVKGRLAFTATLLGVRKAVDSVAPGAISWGPSGEHRGVPLVTITETFTGSGIALHYAIVEDAFVASLDRRTLLGLVDQLLDSPRPTSRVGPIEKAGEGQGVIDFAPRADGHVGRMLLGLLEAGAVRANRSAARAYAALARGRPGEPITTASALAHLGVEPMHANGGQYSVGPDGIVTHSLYGSELEPSWPPLPVKDAAASAFLERLAHLRMTVGFEGEGVTRGLHTTVRWARK